ncbi:hypothetical protein LWI29_010179 [Acer saccharum]|uniref:DUF7722 domain-containing protein n=1 Tax=Acer saccharum TaxID=4024 RepID=A0AA39SKP6_ACESA|nr:hypothetical protein LWI29_010179 [Acer saccharum]KAK1579116.1 hypothetical protein Q3G72_035673 [Acer saccharum]
MAAVRWVVHTASHVLGYQNDNDTIKCNNNNKSVVGGSFHDQTDIQSMKKSSNGGLSDQTQEAAYPSSGFQIPLHYPRYSKGDYETMEEWKIDMLLGEYGFSFNGLSLEEKRAYAMGAFLWPDQY